MLTPDKLAKSGSEHGIQTALFAFLAVAAEHGFPFAWRWAEADDPEIFKQSPKQGVAALKWVHAIPNGGSRGDDEKSRKIRGGQMKAEGVRDGVSDIFVPVPVYPWHGLYIEMKTPTGRVRPKQDEFADFVLQMSYGFTVCRTWREAAKAIETYLSTGNVAIKRK